MTEEVGDTELLTSYLPGAPSVTMESDTDDDETSTMCQDVAINQLDKISGNDTLIPRQNAELSWTSTDDLSMLSCSGILWEPCISSTCFVLPQPSEAVFVDSPAVTNCVTIGEFLLLSSGLIGRIIGIERDHYGYNFQMQYFAQEKDLQNVNVPTLDSDLECIVRGLPQVFRTNVSFVVRANSNWIERLVFPYSKQLALSRFYGIIEHRASGFFWQFDLEYNPQFLPKHDGLSTCDLPKNYRDFGPPCSPGSSGFSINETVSERIQLSLRQLSDDFVRILWCPTDLDNKLVKTGWKTKTFEQFHFEIEEMKRVSKCVEKGYFEFRTSKERGPLTQ